MKKIVALGMSLALGLALFVGGSAHADAATRVRGYYRSSGTYVAPYYRTSPNSTVRDNYSYKGNYNPYTGRYGTKTYNYRR